MILTGIMCGLIGLCAVLTALVARLHRRQRRAAARIRELRIEAVARGLLPLARATGDERRAAEVPDARLARHKRHLALYVGGDEAAAADPAGGPLLAALVDQELEFLCLVLGLEFLGLHLACAAAA